MKFVAYYRVSTQKQAASGLGLEAQRHAVEQYVSSRGGEVSASFTEAESGKRDSRPELAKALHLADVTGATLVIAKLDRLSRNAAFLLTLKDSGVSFICADMPEANTLTIGILALVAQNEREAISKRTKEALAAAKRRGVKLGNPNGADAIRRAGKGNGAATMAASAKAAEHAAKLMPILADLKATGVVSLGGIASVLNSRGVRTLQGKSWHKSSVRNLLERAEAA